MDRLPEQEFESDKTWPRMCVGVNDHLVKAQQKYQKEFLILSFLSSFRYLREVTYYKRNFAQALVVVPLFVLSSHFIAESRAYDPYVLAAEKNNSRESDFINKYKSMYKEAKAKGKELPDEYIY